MKSLISLIGVLVLTSTAVWADGGYAAGGDAVLVSKSPKQLPGAFGKYRQSVYLIVGSYWYPEIDRAYTQLPAGTVRIRFTIRSDGSLLNAEVTEGKNFSKLAEISLNAVKAPAPFRPFDQDLIKQIGDKYTDDFTFSFKGAGSAPSPRNTISEPSPYSDL